MASLIWSATLSGWPMETDSLDQQYRSVLTIKRPSRGRRKVSGGCAAAAALAASIPGGGMMEHLREIITKQRARQSQPRSLHAAARPGERRWPDATPTATGPAPDRTRGGRLDAAAHGGRASGDLHGSGGDADGRAGVAARH